MNGFYRTVKIALVSFQYAQLSRFHYELSCADELLSQIIEIQSYLTVRINNGASIPI